MSSSKARKQVHRGTIPGAPATAPDLRGVVAMALAEDIGPGDVTSALIPRRARGEGVFLAKGSGVVSGMKAAREVFRQLAPRARFTILLDDGSAFAPGDILARVEGPYHLLLTGERTALNFLQQLSGVATVTRRHVEALGPGSRIGVYDTRKTVPLLRTLQKEAVLHGGGRNHRMGLFDMAMIKNNHVDACGGVRGAVDLLARDGFFARRPRLKLCIEARNDAEAVDAALAGADIIMLDNMNGAGIRRAVRVIGGAVAGAGLPQPEIEVSGGITPGALRRMRDLPIDRVSVGGLTHSAPAVDISFRIRPL